MGALAWSYQALGDDGIGGGFDTNPLIIGDKLYTGNKDGYMYAIYISGSVGTLAWRYKQRGRSTFPLRQARTILPSSSPPTTCTPTL